ncbi:MAG: radical SAM protein [Candidatus Omnitrophota bacterium]
MIAEDTLYWIRKIKKISRILCFRMAVLMLFSMYFCHCAEGRDYLISGIAIYSKMDSETFRKTVKREYVCNLNNELPMQGQNKRVFRQLGFDEKQAIKKNLEFLTNKGKTCGLRDFPILIKTLNRMIDNPTPYRIGKVFSVIAQISNGSKELLVQDDAEEVFVLFDWLTREQIAQILEFKFHRMKPGSFHLVPCLSCNYFCFGCMSGKIKEAYRTNKIKDINIMASFEDMQLYIDKALEGGVKQIAFSGGGEPLLNPHTIDAMRYAKEKGLDVLLFTNGNLLTKKTIELILDIEPAVVRISVNAVSPDIYQLFHGIQDKKACKNALNSLRLLCREKQKRQKQGKKGRYTEISVAALITPINLYDIRNVARLVKTIHNENSGAGPNRLVIRPMNNFPGTCQNSPNMDEIVEYIQRNHSYWQEDFNDFFNKGMQFSRDFWDQAMQFIEKEVVPILSGTLTEINFSKKRMQILRQQKRPYAECLACSYASLVAPNGDMYICVERGLDSDWRIGNLKENSVEEIYLSNERKKRIETLYDSKGLSCPGTCMDNEYNMIYAGLKKFENKYPDIWGLVKDLIVQTIGEKADFKKEREQEVKDFSESIHEKNVEFSHILSGKKVLCHIIDDSLIPQSQKTMMQELEQDMRKDIYKEKIVTLKSDNLEDFLVQLKKTIEDQTSYYRRKGYDVEFGVACETLEDVRTIQKEFNVRALAFDGGGGNAIQVEGIVLALRALSSGKIDDLKEVFEFLSQEKLINGPNEIDEFSRNKLFKLPEVDMGISNLTLFNRMIKVRIKAAA